jgi:hypothetical protein
VDLDAQHRPLVSLVPILRAPAASDLPAGDQKGCAVPAGASEGDWRLTRSRQAGDVNAEVREAVDRDGYSLFRIGLSLSELPAERRGALPSSAEGDLTLDHVAVSLQESRSRSVNLFRPDLT